jgi:hypothetical protein
VRDPTLPPNPDDDWLGEPSTESELTPALGNDGSGVDNDDRDVLVNDPDTEFQSDSPSDVPTEAPSIDPVPAPTPLETSMPTM